MIVTVVRVGHVRVFVFEHFVHVAVAVRLSADTPGLFGLMVFVLMVFVLMVFVMGVAMLVSERFVAVPMAVTLGDQHRYAAHHDRLEKRVYLNLRQNTSRYQRLPP